MSREKATSNKKARRVAHGHVCGFNYPVMSAAEFLRLFPLPPFFLFFFLDQLLCAIFGTVHSLLTLVLAVARLCVPDGPGTASLAPYGASFADLYDLTFMDRICGVASCVPIVPKLRAHARGL